MIEFFESYYYFHELTITTLHTIIKNVRLSGTVYCSWICSSTL